MGHIGKGITFPVGQTAKYRKTRKYRATTVKQVEK